MSRGQVPHVFSTFERLLSGKLVFHPSEVEEAINKALRRRFSSALYYVSQVAPVGLRTLEHGDLASDLAGFIVATAGTPYKPPIAECVDDSRIDRARATLAEFDRVRRDDARIALLDLFEEAVKLRMLLGEAEERLARQASEAAPPE